MPTVLFKPYLKFATANLNIQVNVTPNYKYSIRQSAAQDLERFCTLQPNLRMPEDAINACRRSLLKIKIIK